MLPFDQVALSTLILLLVGGGMRLFYGAWPWEVRKTWYRTQQAVDFVEALRNEKEHKSLPSLAENSATTFAPRLAQNAIVSSSDSFDRRLVFDDSSHAAAASLETLAVSNETPLQKSAEKSSITRRRWLTTSRGRQTIQNTKTALHTASDSDGGDWVAR